MATAQSPDAPLLSRRAVMVLLGATGATWLFAESQDPHQSLAGTEKPSCVVKPEQTEGPYFVDERLDRSDIRSDPSDGRVKPGTPLALVVQVFRLSAERCDPLAGAQVDIWHCDAQGLYSDVRDPRFNTIGQKFLRGYQMTDAQGEARFITIYPGWYPGRTVHIHFKVRTTPTARRGYDFTSQWYFSDELTDRVHTSPSYGNSAPRRVRNRQDGIFLRGGDHLMLAPTATTEGYTAAFALGLQIP
jgi:protocatechuate 3,4-dioxygenase beta subunit